ncbi:MAG: YggS family pyridoxal phosphate-dependent enzyme, partial [Pseudothermotoga sp.]|nr:YggS family pyridoxal phosphate-dependent enzyme [Pseudothermotoga sp.]
MLQNILKIKERITQAAVRAHRDPNSVRLIAVVKEASLEQVKALVDLGL